MRHYYPQWSLGNICRLFGRSRQGYYKNAHREQTQFMKEGIVIDQVRYFRSRQPRVGTRRMLEMLQPILEQHQIKMGRDKLFDLLASHHLLVRRNRRRRVKTTDSNHFFRRYPNLIREVVIKTVNQVWVSDITYVSLTANKFCYLSLITDVYSRKIIGYHLHSSLKKEGPIAALRMALKAREGSVYYRTIHHSDRGIQYCCKEYTDILVDNDIAISMTQQGDPGENAIAERVNGILKTEFILSSTFSSFSQALEAVVKAVEIYNQERLHASCDYLTPDQAYRKAWGEMKRRWKSARKRTVNEKQDVLSTM
ncbi:IS3 family transposase [Chitinophaga sp. G-6-1-13]|uniref:IS3 family transposase n=1 Tax=Chitinophaga fulva TaxID=2728842 RepID=A0A848GR81_9BACT|nr:IS3 family transposase [Chitinophaga fulva]